MKYAIIHRPEIDRTELEGISKKYDPHFGLVGPHITLAFPFPTNGIDEAKLKDNIKAVAVATKPFVVTLADTELSWDQWLFLIPTNGRIEVEQLHDRFYQLAEIKPYLRADIPFVPHIALGQFVLPGSNYDLSNPTKVPLDQERYAVAKDEIDKMALNYEYTATKIELISVADDFKSTKTVAAFNLG